uniref:Uncharacterized protein n=1 Tax=Branchiostoma floridae TaxID=7739 RepID=C3ZBD9_BRAFL|eukprot:XP_002594165.1 hypothetical protein BRAFLDRAFT_65015 [Branchiostoma floridae]
MEGNTDQYASLPEYSPSRAFKKDRPSTAEKVCYGIGALSYMTTRHVLNFYLNYFLVTVAQGINLVCLYIYRILGCTLATVLLYMLLWYVPDVTPGLKIAYFVALFIMESVLESGLTLAHKTLVMHISDDCSDRESAIAFRSAAGLIGLVLGVAIEGQVVAAFGGSLSGTCNHGNDTINGTGSNYTITPQTGKQEAGYLVAAGIICLLALIFITVTLTMVKERTVLLFLALYDIYRMMLSDVSDLLKLQTGRSYDTVLHGVFITSQRITGAIGFGAISAALEWVSVY